MTWFNDYTFNNHTNAPYKKPKYDEVLEILIELAYKVGLKISINDRWKQFRKKNR